MGWIVGVKPLLATVALGGLVLLLARGVAYHHAIWHVCVLAGSAFHYFAMLFYVIPLAA